MAAHVHHQTHAFTTPSSAHLPRERLQGFERARRAWPNVPLPFRAYCEHLARLRVVEPSPESFESLYLCAACARGVPSALTTLEDIHFGNLRRCIPDFRHDSDFVAEVMQCLRERLFVGNPPRIASYRGRGSLGGWLRAVVRRIALDQHRAFVSQKRLRKQMRAFEEERAHCGLEPVWSTPPGWSEIIQRSLARACRALPDSDRRLLGAHLDGCPVSALCAMLAIDRSTAYRRLRRVEKSIGRHFREMVREQRAGVTDDELHAMLLLVRSRIDLGPALREELAPSASPAQNRDAGASRARPVRAAEPCRQSAA